MGLCKAPIVSVAPRPSIPWRGDLVRQTGDSTTTAPALMIALRLSTDIEITPEPSDEERRAITAALARVDALPPSYSSRWRASALDDLRDDALAEQTRRDPGVVEPRHPGQYDRDE